MRFDLLASLSFINSLMGNLGDEIEIGKDAFPNIFGCRRIVS